MELMSYFIKLNIKFTLNRWKILILDFMEYFVWNMAISFQLLFLIISGVIFIYLREKSFKYYALYNLFLGFYIVSRDDIYYANLEAFLTPFFGTENRNIFLYILNIIGFHNHIRINENEPVIFGSSGSVISW